MFTLFQKQFIRASGNISRCQACDETTGRHCYTLLYTRGRSLERKVVCLNLTRREGESVDNALHS